MTRLPISKYDSIKLFLKQLRKNWWVLILSVQRYRVIQLIDYFIAQSPSETFLLNKIKLVPRTLCANVPIPVVVQGQGLYVSTCLK